MQPIAVAHTLSVSHATVQGPGRSNPHLMDKKTIHIVDIKGVYIGEEEWDRTTIWIDRAGSHDTLEFDRDNIVETIPMDSLPDLSRGELQARMYEARAHVRWAKLDKKTRGPFVMDDGVVICEKCEFIKGKYCICDLK